MKEYKIIFKGDFDSAKCIFPFMSYIGHQRENTIELIITVKEIEDHIVK